MQTKKLVVIGGGAAGFFCAINAARLNPSLHVVILEKSAKLLSKVKISGGGRCNVSHACSSINDMLRNYPRGASFLKKSFHQFFVDDTINWFADRGVYLKTEADGRMFPDTDDSQTIINCFLQEASKYGVEVVLKSSVKRIESKEGQFLLHLENETLTSDYVCIACGGFSKDEQFNWIVDCGHTITSPVPSLFTFNIKDSELNKLMGISVPDVNIKINNTKLTQSGPLLITHWGLSGPAVLKLSAWGARDLAESNYDFTITINWLPDYNENSLLEKFRMVRFEKGSSKIYNYTLDHLPARLWHYFLHKASINEATRWAELPSKEQNLLAKIICTAQYNIKGKTTFKEEFVTAGGVSLNEIDPATMQSRVVKNLYFSGEIMDIDGVTGGFNFQSAWTTSLVAASALAGNS